MNNNLEQQLTELANKLNVTAEHLYPVVKKQVFIDAWLGVIVPLMFLLLFGFLHYKYEQDLTDDPPIAGILGAILAICLFIFSIRLVLVYFNPDYYVLKEILK